MAQSTLLIASMCATCSVESRTLGDVLGEAESAKMARWSVVATWVSGWWSSGLTVLRGRGGPGSRVGLLPVLLFDSGEDVHRGTVVGGGVDRGICGDVDLTVAIGE